MNTESDKSVSILIKEKARDLGFDLCGIARSRSLTEYSSTLESWCITGMNGAMDYLGKEIEKRINPEILLPGARSVVVTGLNYYTKEIQGGKGIPVISRYAYGVNYHDIIKVRLNEILEFIKSINSETEGKSFVDSVPVLEKAWAREAGLGWPGRNTILINDKIGSFFFIGVIVLNIDLDYDEPSTTDYCGNCRLCLDECPTGAINGNRTIDARRCIAYLTIENREPISEILASKMEGRVFGCDKCQDVCPWNKNAKQHNTKDFILSEDIRQMSSEEWFNLSRERFNTLFGKSAIKRGKFERLNRNIRSAFSLP